MNMQVGPSTSATSAASVDWTEGPAAATSAMLEVSSMGGDVGDQVAALMVENGEAERTTDHQARDAAREAESQADTAQVQALHDEASSMRTQGWVDAAAGVGNAILKAYGTPIGQAAGEAATKVGDSAFSATQHDDEATAAADKAAADQAQAAAQDDTDAANDASQSIQTALDFDRTVQTTEAQTQLAALHRA
jgi:hypothetical protein